MYQKFEDYLKDEHMEAYHGTDDDAPDAYEAWLSEMDMDILIKYADVYGAKCALQSVKEFGAKLGLI